MADYRLSREADNDISAVAEYTLEAWGEAQAERYVLGLHKTLKRLAAKPEVGTASDDLRPGYRRRRYRSHMIFYKITRSDICVVRVLHGQMDFLRHL